MDKYSKPELLCPAGSPEAAIAAIEMGADAIYLGLQKFNARANAGNFTEEQLAQCVTYAHLRGVKVFLTSNTLVSEQELDQAVEQIERAYGLGIDAVIVQDLGLARAIHMRMPQLPLHASTQMTIYNREGALAMKAMGFSRVILARECGIEDIRDICSACKDGPEVEVFVHGAVCISYSGQCLMSALLAERSGNRGRCAQLCRLCYDLCPGEDSPAYLISPKDLCLLDRLDELTEAGVCSLKIEGRMKTPEYVGAVTQIYRRRLDGQKNPTDKRDLLQAFNRNGFTELYYDGSRSAIKPGASMMSCTKPKNWGISAGKILNIRRDFDRSANMKFLMVSVRLNCCVALGDGVEVMTGGTADDPGTVVTEIIGPEGRQKAGKKGETVWIGRIPVDSRIDVGMELRKTGDAQSRKQIAQQVAAGLRRRPISMEIQLDNEGCGTLTAEAGGEKATATAQILVPAQDCAVDRERLEQQLSKTGNTPFTVTEINTIGRPEGRLVISAVNALRRSVLETLEDKLIAAAMGHRPIISCDYRVQMQNHVPMDVPFIAMCADSAQEALSNPKLAGVQEYILPVDSLWNGDYKALEQHGKHYRFRLPAISRGSVDAALRRDITLLEEALSSDHCTGLILGNPGQTWLIPMAHRLGRSVTADYTFNIWNTSAAQACMDMGCDYICPCIEAEEDRQFVLDLCRTFPGRVELRAEGSIAMMTSDFCPVGAYLGGKTSCDRTCSAPCTRGKYALRDGRGRAFPIVCHRRDCRTEIFTSNSKPNPSLAEGVPQKARCLRYEPDRSENVFHIEHIR
ncbi:MAG: U32 family peptidase [Clostridia bacterium]|nr:U32 family peptidase [Clostridia bacterium]